MFSSSKKEAFNKLPFFISYFISEPKNCIKNKIVFNSLKPDIVCFRDKENKDITILAKQFLKEATDANIALKLINTNINVAIELNYDGVHLNSTQFNEIKFAKSNNLFVIISCHTQEEIVLALKYGADAVTYSPIFFKQNKGEPKGIKELKIVVDKFQTNNFKIIALGGIITNNHIEQIKVSKVSGFSSIRYFYNNI